MSELEDKLRAIIDQVMMSQEGVPVDWEYCPDAIEQIKAAFAADAEYQKLMRGVLPVLHMEDGKITNLMTGADWLEKFIFEYKHEQGYGEGFAHTEEALRAAKRASGVEDD